MSSQEHQLPAPPGVGASSLDEVSHPAMNTPKFSEQDIQVFWILLKSMPTYREEDESISTADLPELIKLMEWDRTEAQVAQYVEFWDTNFGGRVPKELYCNILREQHDQRKLLREYALSFDKDKNGYVSRAEFEYGFKTLLVHDPTIDPVSYERLMKEADANGDGKITIDELTRWLIECVQQPLKHSTQEN